MFYFNEARETVKLVEVQYSTGGITEFCVCHDTWSNVLFNFRHIIHLQCPSSVV